MEMTSSSKQQVLAALVVGMGAVSVAHADLGDLQVVESSSNGFEAIVNLSNQAIEQISNVEVVDGSQVGANTNTAAASMLQVSLLRDVGAGDALNHQIKIMGPGSISSEALRFGLAVNMVDGGRIVRNYELMPIVAPGVDTLLAMTEFEEIGTVSAAVASATTVVSPSTEKPVQIRLNTNKVAVEKPQALPDAGLVVGDVKVRSSMGERLALEIDVAGVNIKHAEEIQIQVIPDLSLGVVTPEVAMDIATMQHEIIKKGDGLYSVLLTSMVPMNEPILPVKVEITAGVDVIARQYSVLVDPPKMDILPQKTQEAYMAYDEQRPVFHARTKSSKSSSSSTKGYQVMDGDTLAGIASQIRAKSPLGEKMRYLRDTNPHAFVGDDVNKLLAGTTLNFPATWSMVGMPVRHPVVIASSSSRNMSRVEAIAEHQAVNNKVAEDVTTFDVAVAEDLNSDTQMGDEAAPTQELTANQFKAQQLREQLAEQQQAIAAAQAKIDAARQQKIVPAVVEAKEGSMIALVGDINPVIAGGGVAALALVGGGMVLMRRRKQRQEQIEADGGELFT